MVYTLFPSPDRRPVAGDLAAAIGVGLAAGVVGTAAMTVSSTVEAKLRKRGSSSTPARAASKVLGVAPIDDRGERRFNNLVHWGYGAGWGGVRGLIGGLGLGGVPAGVAHLVAVWGGEQVVLPATGASPPATKWGAREIARSPATSMPPDDASNAPQDARTTSGSCPRRWVSTAI